MNQLLTGRPKASSLAKMKGSSSMMKVPLRGGSMPRRSWFHVTVIGDSCTGKTSLVRSYAGCPTLPHGARGLESMPTQYLAKGRVHGKEYSATINDTSATSFADGRIRLYLNTDVIVVCFSLVDQRSFRSAKDKWLKEAQTHCPNTPVVLVGTNLDLVDNTNIDKKDLVTTEQIDQLLLDNNQIHEYCKSSALTKDGLDRVFDQVFQAAWIGPVRYVVRMKSVRRPPKVSLSSLANLFKKKTTMW